MISTNEFAPRLIAWQRTHGRHDLPWQRTRDPYRIWLSEVMLQQTQVATVIPYYAKFLARCPDVAALAAAPADEVMALWSGLGYYSRARNLHRCAQQVVERFGGQFPDNVDDLVSLPGIGRSTAAAIASFAFGARETILDGNVKRVLARVFGIDGFPGEKRIETAMWALAESLLPAVQKYPRHGDASSVLYVADGDVDVGADAVNDVHQTDDIGAYTQGLMDLGATLCMRSRPDCLHCPFSGDCVASATGRQSELPTRRPPKTTPVRRTVMLVLEAGPCVLLYRRPPTGIWGGLWSLPEAEDTVRAAELASEFGGSAETTSRLTPLVHTFTHFKLEIEPFRVDCGEQQGGQLSRFPESQLEWVHWQDLDRYGLPAPVRRLLDGLRGSLI
jgi:A/G-specific adenine glycosylase